MRHLTAIIQVTERCNLGCRYCYIPETAVDMSMETFETVVDRLLEYVGSDGKLSIIYHGGEPLLRGYEFFVKAEAAVQQRGGRCRIDSGIQTNGTLISDRFADFIVVNNIPCGISLDGPKDVHDANRVGCTSRHGTFDSVMRGLDRLRSRGRKASALTVISKASLGKIPEIYGFFNENEIDFKLNPVDLIGRSKNERESLEITPVQYGRALIELFDLWMSDCSTKISITNLYDAMRSLAQGSFTECIFSNRACGSKYIGISPNGDVYPCNRFSSYDSFKLGNLLRDNLPDMMRQEVFRTFSARSAGLKQCTKCEYGAICNGGCCSRAYSQHQSIMEPDWYCPSIKMIYSHIKERLESEVLRIGGNDGY